MKAHERLLRYVTVYTTSSEETKEHPSTKQQFDLANLLKKELCDMGASDVRLEDRCYLYATIPATPGYENKPTLGFIAHMDTAPDFSGEGVRPQITEHYDGGDLPLGTSGRVLSPTMFPHLKKLAGRTLITTDGTTLLGADDKAGVSEIMTLAEGLLAGKIPHGCVKIAFTPDEEIGEGADGFDVPAFGADFAYTVDGGEEGTLEYENFNAAGASFTVHGVNVHPGDAKDTMVNASLVAMEINAMLPAADTPAHTEGREGFFHLTDMRGNVEEAKLSYIVRDHDKASFEARKAMLRHIEKTVNETYGAGTAVLTLRDQYSNMIEKILPHMHLVENAEAAVRMLGKDPVCEPIRGGTDGARLSFMGLPCPNLGTGGYAFHGPYEHITVEGMDFTVHVLENIVSLYAK